MTKPKPGRVRKPEGGVESSLKPLVGEATYAVWLDMLKVLVPGGRTHRLAPMVAGMLRYAAEQSTKRSRRPPQAAALADALTALDEGEDASTSRVAVAVQQLFRDAGVRALRHSRSGASYSVIDASVQEFMRWDEMPWE
jgi:hypothetical protein